VTLRLLPGEPLAAGLGRAASEEIRRARESLLDAADPVSGVHEARKSLKKVRAILHLARKALGKKRFRALNRRVRDLARALAEQRDASVRVDTLNALLAGMDGQAPIRLRGASRRRMVTRRRRPGDARVREEIAATLGEVGGEIRRALSRSGIDSARPGLARTYRTGRRNMREAASSSTTAAFHEWRKRVKFLWYQVRLFEEGWPATLGPLAEQLHSLSEFLGDAHDYDLLEAGLRQEARADPLFDPGALLAALAEARVVKRTLALDLGRRLYAEDPDGFAARIEAYWLESGSRVG
jgi:CHAD domain-containing protein